MYQYDVIFFILIPTFSRIFPDVAVRRVAQHHLLKSSSQPGNCSRIVGPYETICQSFPKSFQERSRKTFFTMQHKEGPPLPLTQPRDRAGRFVDQDETVFSAFLPHIKLMIVIFAAVSGFMSPFSSNIYVPALDTISKELSISRADTLLSVTTYLIFQGLAPSFWGPLSDTLGRRPILVCTFTVLLGANLGLAFTNTFWLLLVLRMLQAFGASSAIAIGAGLISDLARRKERGRYMSYFQSGALVGPCIAPVVGGLVTQRWDWHANFFFLVAFGGLVNLLLATFLPETLRSLVGDGSMRPCGMWKTIYPMRLTASSGSDLSDAPLMKKPPRFNILKMGFEKPWLVYSQLDILLLVITYSVPFSVFSVTSSIFSPTLASNYGYNHIIIGLCYLPLGAGFAIGSIIAGRLIDWEYAQAKKKHGISLNLFKARLKLGPIFNAIFCCGILAFEWCLHEQVHIAAPLVIIFFTMMSSMIYFTAM